MRHYIHLFDEAVGDIRNVKLIPEFKSATIKEVIKSVTAVWNSQNKPLRTEKAIRVKLQVLVDDMYKMKKNHMNEAGIEKVRSK